MDELQVQAPALTADEARLLTDRIRAGVSDLLPVIREAFERRADAALGYASWSSYCDTELRGLRLPIGDRREAVAELRGAGMSTRAIGSALGVPKSTVADELRRLPETGQSNESVKSLDGRDRPAAMPARFTEPDPVTQVAEAIERHLPPDPDEPHREWRRSFLAALATGRRSMQFDVDSVGERADDECVDELCRLAADLTSYVSRVVAKRPTVDNVRRLKVV